MASNPVITEHGIVFPRRALNAQKDIRPLAQEVGAMGRKSTWGVTDLAVWWGEHGTDDMSVLAGWLGVEVETLYDRATVGRAWPIADRDTESDYLTYSHYRALMSVADHAEKLRWRERAAIERIPVNRLRSIMAGRSGVSEGEIVTPVVRSEHSQRVQAAVAIAERPEQVVSAVVTDQVVFTPAPTPASPTTVAPSFVPSGTPAGIPLAQTPVAAGITTNGTQNGSRRIVLSDTICARIYATCGDNYQAAVAMAETLITSALDAQRSPVRNLPVNPPARVNPPAGGNVGNGVAVGRFARLETSAASPA